MDETADRIDVETHLPVATVVIPALNAAATIGAQLEALQTQRTRFPFEIVVSDNGSTDATRRVVDSLARPSAEVRVIDASVRRGAATARNLGAAAGRGGNVLFCDADDVVDEGWVEAMVEALGRADVVGGPMDPHRLNPDSMAWRGSTRPNDLPGTLFMKAGTTGNMGVRRTVFEQLRGFDTRYDGGSGEDIDFWWRAQLAGFSIAFAPDALAHVRFPHDTRGMAHQAFKYGAGVPHLYRVHRVHGMPRRSLAQTLRQAAWILVNLPAAVLHPARRTEWVWGAASLAGRICGAVRYRVAYV
jgi:glycosyltransferase involved in cell wall biosynthesis